MTKIDFSTFWNKVTVSDLIDFVNKWGYSVELHKFGYGNHAFVIEKKGK